MNRAPVSEVTLDLQRSFVSGARFDVSSLIRIWKSSFSPNLEYLDITRW